MRTTNKKDVIFCPVCKHIQMHGLVKGKLTRNFPDSRPNSRKSTRPSRRSSNKSWTHNISRRPHHLDAFREYGWGWLNCFRPPLCKHPSITRFQPSCALIHLVNKIFCIWSRSSRTEIRSSGRRVGLPEHRKNSCYEHSMRHWITQRQKTDKSSSLQASSVSRWKAHHVRNLHSEFLSKWRKISSQLKI